MDFSYSEEQQDVQKLAQQILTDKASNERLQQLEAQGAIYDIELWQLLAEAGLLGVAIEEQYGGMDFGYETLCLVVEEMGRSAAPLPLIPLMVSTALSLQQFADEDIKKEYLPKMVSGNCLLTTAMIEPGNENMAKPQTSAERQGDSWLITGTKYCVPYADNAERILLSAQTKEGLAIFLVNPQNPNVKMKRQYVTVTEAQYEVVLNGAETEQLIVLGEKAITLTSLCQQRVAAAYCAMAVGLCDKMMRLTASYTSEREQFGRAIATFQAVGHRVADCYIDIDCLRLVTQQAVSQLDSASDATEPVMTAKIWAGDVLHRVSQASQHLHGGIGVDRDYPLFRYSLWAKQIELSCGSSAELLSELGARIAVHSEPM